MSTIATASTPDPQTPALPVTAFERRFGHPPGLVVLFFAGMWERFSYYGVRGLLKLYMINYLFVTLRQTVQRGSYVQAGDPATVVGWRFIQGLLPAVEPEVLQRCISEKVPRLLAGSASTHAAPLTAEAARAIAEQTCAAAPQASMVYGLFTGFVFLTPLLGGVLADRYLGQRKAAIGGGVLLAIGYFAMAFESSFFLALLLLILGSGAFTPNVYTQVGELYSRGDPRRDGAFTLFYMGINLGALICNLICGTLAVVYGWHHGFAAAAVGMSLGLTIYLLGQKHLARDASGRHGIPVSVGGGDGDVKGPTDSAGDKPAPAIKRKWTIAWVLVALYLINIVFGAVHEQQGNAMAAWADERTACPQVLGIQLPSSLLLAVIPLCILFFAPLLDLLWRRQGKRGNPPTSGTKMAIGWILGGASFLVMLLGASLIGAGQGSPFCPLFCTVLLTIAELHFVPVGLSLLTKLSPARMASTLMALWLISSVIGNVLSGFLGIFSVQMSSEAFFLMLTVLGIGVGVAMLASRKPLKRALGYDV